MLLISGCGDSSDSQPRLKVYTGIPPIAYVIDQIGGDRIEVVAICSAGNNPHEYKPSQDQLDSVSTGWMYVSISLPFEKTIIEHLKKTNPNVHVVPADHSVEKLLHSQSVLSSLPATFKMDEHIWLSPYALNMVANAISIQIIRYDRPNGRYYADRLNNFMDEVERTHQNTLTRLQPYREKIFFTNHPGFKYFGSAFGLRQVGIEYAGKLPNPQQTAQWVKIVEAEEISTIFVQPQFNNRSAVFIANHTRCRMDTLDPLAYDVLENYQNIARKLELSFQ